MTHEDHLEDEHDHEHEHGPLAELVTVRDWLRYAVTRFNRAGCFFGHGLGLVHGLLQVAALPAAGVPTGAAGQAASSATASPTPTTKPST